MPLDGSLAYTTPFVDDDSDDSGASALSKLMSPASAQSIVGPPPTAPAASGPGEGTPRTGNLASPPSQVPNQPQWRNSDSEALVKAFNSRRNQSPASFTDPLATQPYSPRSGPDSSGQAGSPAATASLAPSSPSTSDAGPSIPTAANLRPNAPVMPSVDPSTGAPIRLGMSSIPGYTSPRVGMAQQPPTAEERLQDVGPAPVYDQARASQLERQQAADSTPANPNDPNYRPSVGSRILRGLQGFFNGGIGGALSADYSAPNRQYRIDEAQRQARLATDNTALGNFGKDFEGANTAFTNRMSTAKEGIALQRNDELAASRQETAEAKSQNADTYAELAKTRQDLADAKDPSKAMAARQAMVKQVGLTGPEAKYFMLTGKMHDPQSPVSIHNPSAEEEEFGAYVRSLGHPATSADIEHYKQLGKAGAGDSTDKDMNSLVSYRKQLVDQMTLSDSDEEKAQIKQRMKDVDGRINDAVESRDRGRNGQQAQPPAQSAGSGNKPDGGGKVVKSASGKSYTVGKTTNLNGKPVTVTGVDGNGKITYQVQ